MSYGNRGILAAFAGIAALITAFGLGAYTVGLPQPQDQRYATQEAPTDAAEQVGEATELTAIAKTFAAPTPAPNVADAAPEQAYYDREDLKAQREMAKWTRYMGVAAICGVILSMVGVGLVYTTFDQTRKANKIASDAYRADHRPWMKPRIVFCQVREGGSAKVEVEIQNIGSAPASEIETRVYFTPQEYPFADDSADIYKKILVQEEAYPTCKDSMRMALLPSDKGEASFIADYVPLESDPSWPHQGWYPNAICCVAVLYRQPGYDAVHKTIMGWLMTKQEGDPAYRHGDPRGVVDLKSLDRPQYNRFT